MCKGQNCSVDDFGALKERNGDWSSRKSFRVRLEVRVRAKVRVGLGLG